MGYSTEKSIKLQLRARKSLQHWYGSQGKSFIFFLWKTSTSLARQSQNYFPQNYFPQTSIFPKPALPI